MKKRLLADSKVLILFVAVVVCYYLFMNMVLHTGCIFTYITGLPCPGCGLTRAGILLLTGDIKGAFYMNPSIFLWGYFGIYFVCSRYMIGNGKGIMLNLILVCLLTIFIYIYRMGCFFPSHEPLVFQKRSLLYLYCDWYREFIEVLGITS